MSTNSIPRSGLQVKGLSRSRISLGRIPRQRIRDIWGPLVFYQDTLPWGEKPSPWAPDGAQFPGAPSEAGASVHTQIADNWASDLNTRYSRQLGGIVEDLERARAEGRDCVERWRVFRHQCAPDRAAKIARPISCHDVLFCQGCARREAKSTLKRYWPRILWLVRHDPREPRVSGKLLTLTLKNVEATMPDLSAGLRKITKSWTRLRHRKFMATIRGGLKRVELTYNAKADTFHLHLHVLIRAPYLPQQRISRAWREITGDSYIVDIRKVTGGPGGAGRELVKYAGRSRLSAASIGAPGFCRSPTRW